MPKHTSRDENISAIAATFHCNEKKYHKFYDDYADELGGFPAIWAYCTDAAYAFTAAETKAKRKKLEFDWIDAVTDFAEAIKNRAYRPKEMEMLATRAITGAKY